MKTQDAHTHSHVRDEPRTEGDPYARESFTWRRMQPWQIWSITVAAVVIAILGLTYVN